MEQKKFDLKSVKVHRTTEATVFELAFAIVAAIVWGVIIWMVLRAPDVVPTHFDVAGKPNAYGSPLGILIPCIILTLAALGCMVVAYFPRFINMPFPVNSIRRVETAIRSARVAGLTLMLLPLALAYTLLVSQSPLFVLLCVAVLIVEIVVFTMLGYRAK